jgi:tetratricopeptide (TPR) repeat protein
MEPRRCLHNFVVAALLPFFCGGPVLAQTDRLDALFADLAESDESSSRRIEREIWAEWSKSGSPAMDLLLQRGRDAMGEGDLEAAIEHLTALTDHAPDFAEGRNALATAYFQTGDFGPSIEEIARTLALNPRHFGALSGLGTIFEELGDDARALEAYKAALAIHPHLDNVEAAIERLQTAADGQPL